MNFKTAGTCAKEISFDLTEDKKISNLKFIGGCNGNLQALSVLIEGMEANDAIKKLKGIDCGGRGTSCSDQFTKALEEALR